MADVDQGAWAWCWFDDSPRGATYGVRRADEVLCYTSRTEAGYEDARMIADAVNLACGDAARSLARLDIGEGRN